MPSTQSGTQSGTGTAASYVAGKKSSRKSTRFDGGTYCPPQYTEVPTTDDTDPETCRARVQLHKQNVAIAKNLASSAVSGSAEYNQAQTDLACFETRLAEAREELHKVRDSK